MQARGFAGLPSASHRPLGPTCSLMQAKFVRRCPCSPMVVRHLYMGRAQKFEGVVYCIREARHTADIRALAYTFGPDRMMRRGRRRPVGFPFWRFHCSRQEIVQKRSGRDIAFWVVMDLLAHGDAKRFRQAAVYLAFDDHWVDARAAIIERVEASDFCMTSIDVHVDDADVRA